MSIILYIPNLAIRITTMTERNDIIIISLRSAADSNRILVTMRRITNRRISTNS